MGEKMYSVYMHVFPNNKRYIGITQMNPVDRWHGGSGYRNQPKMYAAIKKYGWKNVDHIILIQGLTKQEAEQKEIELIKQLNAIENGYNVDRGGCGAASRSNEFRKKQSVNNSGSNNPFYGKHHSEKTKQEHSAFMKGNAYFKGHHHSDEFKKRKSELMKEKYGGGNNPRSKKVLMTSKDGTKTVFWSLRKAAEMAEVSAATMHKLVNNGIQRDGCRWEYINE